MRFNIFGLAVAAAAMFPAISALADDPDMPPVDYPAIPEKVATRAELVPTGWKLEAEASGDLNGDGRADLAIVIQSEKPDLGADGKPLQGPRMLIVALASAKGYERVVANHGLIPRNDNPSAEDCFDPQSDALLIKRGKLVLKLSLFMTAGGWDTWSNTYSFAWKKGGMLLSRFEHDNTNRGSGKTTLVIADYGARSLTISRGSIEDDRHKTKKSRLSGPASVTLDQIGDGLQFDPAPQSSDDD